MNRDEFMELVYETFTDEPDNVLANGIIEAADAYVEYEKAQLPNVQPEPCKDAISRTDAIEVINAGRLTQLIYADVATKGLMDLAPVQPELTDEQVIDYCAKKGYVILKKEPIFQAGYQNKEIRFYIGGRLFAIRELAQ